MTISSTRLLHLLKLGSNYLEIGKGSGSTFRDVSSVHENSYGCDPNLMSDLTVNANLWKLTSNEFFCKSVNPNLTCLIRRGEAKTKLPESIDLQTGFIFMQMPDANDLDIHVLSNGGRTTVEFGSFAPSFRIPFVGASKSAWMAQKIGMEDSKTLNFLSRLTITTIRKFENQKLRRYFQS